MQDPQELRQEEEFRGPEGKGPRGEPVKPSAQTRQGVTAGRVTTILLAAIILVIIGFAVSYLGAA